MNAEEGKAMVVDETAKFASELEPIEEVKVQQQVATSVLENYSMTAEVQTDKDWDSELKKKQAQYSYLAENHNMVCQMVQDNDEMRQDLQKTIGDILKSQDALFKEIDFWDKLQEKRCAQEERQKLIEGEHGLLWSAYQELCGRFNTSRMLSYPCYEGSGFASVA